MISQSRRQALGVAVLSNTTTTRTVIVGAETKDRDHVDVASKDVVLVPSLPCRTLDCTVLSQRSSDSSN
jgi:hypothetical protein